MKLIITGTGGQGVKFLAKKLSEKLIAKDFEVSLIISYDAAMEGGEIYATLTFSKDKVENPLIDEADLLIELSKPKQDFKGKEKITLDQIPQDDSKRLNENALDFLTKKLNL
jgi:CO dehydrogenase nickel-insertion accessory protein CooC1